VIQAVAEFGAAADEVDAAAAATLQVNRTDLRILGIVEAEPGITATAVARAVSLSPAATTTALQRLTASGYLIREPSTEDRRSVVLSLTKAARRIIDQIYGPLAAAGLHEIEGYSESELSLIADFLSRGVVVQYKQASRIRSMKT
jgi:DNA-binding MarR family transcriptional regulator